MGEGNQADMVGGVQLPRIELSSKWLVLIVEETMNEMKEYISTLDVSLHYFLSDFLKS